jgi:hypothetical protein
VSSNASSSLPHVSHYENIRVHFFDSSSLSNIFITASLSIVSHLLAPRFNYMFLSARSRVVSQLVTLPACSRLKPGSHEHSAPFTKLELRIREVQAFSSTRRLTYLTYDPCGFLSPSSQPANLQASQHFVFFVVKLRSLHPKKAVPQHTYEAQEWTGCIAPTHSRPRH